MEERLKGKAGPSINVHMHGQYYPLWIGFTCIAGEVIRQEEHLRYVGERQRNDAKAISALMKAYR
eukprot:4339621-Karenia_brevis.AAC.1